jgi:AraC-like DNA-binding protein
MYNLSFSIPEILSLVGVCQCVYLMAYISFFSGNIAKAGLPIAYFFFLGLAFFSDLVQGRFLDFNDYYFYFQWVTWFAGPPLSVLLVIQISQITKTPDVKDYWVLLLLPLSFMLSRLAVDSSSECLQLAPCEELRGLLNVTGLMAGTISLLVIFGKKNLSASILRQRNGKERYWLILALILVNVCFLGAMFALLTDYLDLQEALLLRTILGLGFVYLVSTSLLRIYPQTVRTVAGPERLDELSEEELKLAGKIEELMTIDKVYQEPTYSRADLAQESGVPETVISKVINIYFQKSFPQLINEYRVEDAKRLLEQTDAAIKVVGEEVGFNSLPSFNRVFKDMMGEAPSHFRKRMTK